jgi:adenosylcobinamide kinase/adenosylcobinamide-phosphate guanylyltransferase
MQLPGFPLYYIATMIPHDSEDQARIQRHQQERAGHGFTTIEAGRDINKLVGQLDVQGSVLLDSVTALLTNELFAPDWSVLPEAHIKVANDLTQLVDKTDNIVVVSDYIYSDAACFDSMTESYRYALAYIDRCMATACEVVIEACYGSFIIHKGLALMKTLSLGSVGLPFVSAGGQK